MDCRLDVCPEPDRAVIRIHGRLAGAAVEELDRVCRDASGPLLLDVTYLMSADDGGVATLKRLVIDGAQFTGISRYLTLLLGLEEP